MAGDRALTDSADAIWTLKFRDDEKLGTEDDRNRCVTEPIGFWCVRFRRIVGTAAG